jgi:hypothetical protein
MSDISAAGVSITLVASKTFPSGITLTQFASDSDPFDFADVTIAEAEMNVNGEQVTFSTANPVPVTLSLIPDSDDDKNLSILLRENTQSRNHKSVRDVITLTVNYPEGERRTAVEGKMLSGTPSSGVTSGKRKKSKSYGFSFEEIV